MAEEISRSTRWRSGSRLVDPTELEAHGGGVLELGPRNVFAGERTESWNVFISPFNVQTQSGEHIEAVIWPKFERLDEAFEITDGVVIPPGEVGYTRYRVEAQSS
jgi:hypothetical protein